MSKRFHSRRELLHTLGGGIGSLAFADLLTKQGLAATKSPLSPKMPHLPATAKAVISIFCYGGVSQVDTFDPKPELLKRQGEAMAGVGPVVTVMGNPGGLMPSPFRFKKHGQCGMDISELFPNVAEHADDLALIRSMHALSPAHGPALFQMNTGSILAGHPSVGSWVTYGLGTENENLPGYIVFTDNRGGPINGAPNWSNGYMPASYQGTPFRPTGDPIIDLKPPAGQGLQEQRKWLELVGKLNQKHLDQNPDDSELSARIYSYELAFRMQTSATDAIDIRNESRATRKLYGLDEQPTEYFGRQALMARRLVERGVRYVQIYSGGGNFDPSWDAHWDLKKNHSMHCAETDRPIAGLIKDLKSRGLFDSTLIVWHGEFGRLPISERMDGRDHNASGFSVWLAGGGVKGGTIIGATDDYGYRAVENPKSVYDLHATILRALGIDHEKLTYRFNGRDMRLTDVHGHVIKEALA